MFSLNGFQGCSNVAEIIEASDGIVVARGDMGIEIPAEKVSDWSCEILFSFILFLLTDKVLYGSSVSCPIFQWLKYLTHKVITPMLIFIPNRSYAFKARLLESAVLREVKNVIF